MVRPWRYRPAEMRALPVIVAILLLLTSGGAMAQIGQRPMATQPSDGDITVLDNEVDHNPFDARKEIREYFRQRLPVSWWFTDPWFENSAFTVTIHIPENWRGNPTTAVMQLCPDRQSPVWQESVDRLHVLAFYRKRPWPGVECRREHLFF